MDKRHTVSRRPAVGTRHDGLTSGVINLVANFKDPAPQPTHATIGGSDLAYTIPSGATGLIFLFHGAGQDAMAWYTRPEQYVFMHEAVAAGYGVAALSSDTAGRWALALISMNNIDVQHVQQAIALLESRGAISASTPIYGVGTSLGGRFTVRVAPLLGFKAISNYVSQGDGDSLDVGVEDPHAIQHALLGDMHALVSNADAQRYSAALLRAGCAFEYQLFGPAPMYPELFTKVPGIDAAGLNAIFAALKAGGLVDAHGYLIDRPDNAAVHMARSPSGAVHRTTMVSVIQDCPRRRTLSMAFSWGDHATLAFFARNP
ncbi:MAG: hypothetical protein U0163_04205 [Gemmatimonadaceae bacterium]